MSEVKTLYKKIKLLEDELSALNAAHAVVIQTALWDTEYHAERIKIAQETNQNQAIKIDELKAENERLESLADAEIQEIGKLRVERNALQASIDEAPTINCEDPDAVYEAIEKNYFQGGTVYAIVELTDSELEVTE